MDSARLHPPRVPGQGPHHHQAVYKLTCAEYDALLARSGGRCEICRAKPRRLVIDHASHGDGIQVRGLLCDRCNAGVMRCIDGTRPGSSVAPDLEAAALAYVANSFHPGPRGQGEIWAQRLREMLTPGELQRLIESLTAK